MCFQAGIVKNYSIHTITKSEPFKRWLAQVGAERIAEIENPELAQARIRVTYKTENIGFLDYSNSNYLIIESSNNLNLEAGGSVAGNARKELEKESGAKVVSNQNFKNLTGKNELEE